MAINEAISYIENNKSLEVPEHLKNFHTSNEKTDDYKYPHNYQDGIVKQDYLEKKISFYQPKTAGYERNIAERLEFIKNKLNKK